MPIYIPRRKNDKKIGKDHLNLKQRSTWASSFSRNACLYCLLIIFFHKRFSKPEGLFLTYFFLFLVHPAISGKYTFSISISLLYTEELINCRSDVNFSETAWRYIIYSIFRRSNKERSVILFNFEIYIFSCVYYYK